MDNQHVQSLGNMTGVFFNGNRAPVLLVSPSCNGYAGKANVYFILFCCIGFLMVNYSMMFYSEYFFMVCGWALSGFFVAGFVVVVFMTPGIQVNEFEETVKIYDPRKYCVVCDITRKKGTKHCYACDLCILSKGNHLDLFDKCMGRYNRVPIYLTLISLALYILSFVVSILYSLIVPIKTHN
jgi:DHHC palmitoyltransferase